jgi:hypothetical protein
MHAIIKKALVALTMIASAHFSVFGQDTIYSDTTIHWDSEKQCYTRVIQGPDPEQVANALLPHLSSGDPASDSAEVCIVVERLSTDLSEEYIISEKFPSGVTLWVQNQFSLSYTAPVGADLDQLLADAKDLEPYLLVEYDEATRTLSIAERAVVELDSAWPLDVALSAEQRGRVAADGGMVEVLQVHFDSIPIYDGARNESDQGVSNGHERTSPDGQRIETFRDLLVSHIRSELRDKQCEGPCLVRVSGVVGRSGVFELSCLSRVPLMNSQKRGRDATAATEQGTQSTINESGS